MSRKDMEDEMRHHLEARATDLELQGMSPEEALRQARVEFGSTVRYQEECREALGLRLLDKARTDLLVTFRALRKSPVFTLVAVLTLAIGIGANALVFSLVRGVLLKPLPYAGAERLYSARTFVPKLAQEHPEVPVSGRHFTEWRKDCASCESMALLGARNFQLAGAGTPQQVDGLIVSAQLFPMLGVRMQLGRAFREDEDRPNADRVAVISDELWRRSFGADPSAVGRSVLVNQKSREIVGVLPAGFQLPTGAQMGEITRLPVQAEIFLPIGEDFSKSGVGRGWNWAAVLKIRQGVPVAETNAEMNRTLAGFAKEAGLEQFVRLHPLKEYMTREVRRPLWLLAGAALALLLIICVNLGNLLMARAAGRNREVAIRMAIGASRADLFRYALAESLALALVGGAAGIGLAWGGLRLLAGVGAAALPRLGDVALDWPVLLATLLLSAAAGALCSLAPVWRMTRCDPQETLGANSQRSTDSGGERRARHWLVSLETGLSMALAAAAALLVVSFVRVMAVDKGFDTEHLLTFQLTLPEGSYGREKRTRFHTELLEKLGAMPGVVSAGLTSRLPLQGEHLIWLLRRKSDPRHFSDMPSSNFRFISAGYFRAVGTAIRSGRGFVDGDAERKVAVISERLAAMLFSGENPIGQMIESNEEGMQEIVGVAADVKTKGIEAEASLAIYLPFYGRLPSQGTSYVLRAAGDETKLTAGVRALVAGMDRELAVFRVRTMSEIVDTAVAARRLQVLLAGGFAVAGVLLACLGVFGVVSYGVSRRTNEIGVRMALGASQDQVVSMVLRDAMRPVFIGLLCGLACALAFGKLLASQLYGVSPRDPWVLAAMALLIGLAALAAAYWPAKRAALIEPMLALRAQ